MGESMWRGAGLRRGVALGIAATALVVLVAAAARADLAQGRSIVASVADVAVGLAFVVAGALSKCAAVQRAAIALVGVAWLLASVFPVQRLHQALLLVCLLMFPTGRLRTAAAWAVAAWSVAVGLGMLTQLGVAAAFLAGAAARWPRRSPGVWAWYPTAAAAAVAVVLAGSWGASRWVPDAFHPRPALAFYSVLLVVIAALHVRASRASALATAAQVREALGHADVGTDRLETLAGLLSGVLNDPELRIRRWDSEAESEAEPAADPGMGTPVLVVTDAEGPIAVVEGESELLHDPATAAAIRRAVLLTVTAERLHGEQELHLTELEQARGRLIEATDRQRADFADRLRREVLPELEHAADQIRRARVADGSLGALDVVRDELEDATREIDSLVAGVPSAPLGDGGLADALRALALHSPVPVDVLTDPSAHADAATETALYYVSSEALANAIKHAHPSRLTVTLTADPQQLILSIADDGTGGAHPEGSGLRGLADRVEALSGTLDVVSAPDAGTTVTARLPVRRSSPRAR